MNFGWCYFRRGIVGQRGKNHYLPENSWTSRCGVWSVRDEEKKHIHFVDKSELRKSKICSRCESLLSISNSVLNLEARC